MIRFKLITVIYPYFAARQIDPYNRRDLGLAYDFIRSDRYALVNAVSGKARNLAEDADDRGYPLEKKAVVEVLDNLKSGRYTIAKCGDRASIYQTSSFELTISSDDEDY